MTWLERIVDARARGHFTAEDKKDVMSWATCAVGEYHATLPEVVVYQQRVAWVAPEPVDKVLLRLGGGEHFAMAVRENNFDAAEEYLHKIDTRVLKLKRAKA